MIGMSNRPGQSAAEVLRGLPATAGLRRGDGEGAASDAAFEEITINVIGTVATPTVKPAQLRCCHDSPVRRSLKHAGGERLHRVFLMVNEGERRLDRHCRRDLSRASDLWPSSLR
jgi:hypothetical protein